MRSADSAFAGFNGVKVVSVTGAAAPDLASRQIGTWMVRHPHCEVREIAVTQSCGGRALSVTLFYWERLDQRG